jgi:prepilin-type N-terminal cleavage/methylation domain-containing protein
MLYPRNESDAGGRGDAFTLIELMIVISIIALTAMLVVPHIASSASYEVQGAARALAGDLLYAQSEAIANQQSRQVIFDAPNNSYRLTDASDVTLPAAWLGGSYRVSFGAESEFNDVAIESPQFGGQSAVVFDEMGAPSSGGSVELVAGPHRYRVTVTAFTGRVSVEEVTGN